MQKNVIENVVKKSTLTCVKIM